MNASLGKERPLGWVGKSSKWTLVPETHSWKPACLPVTSSAWVKWKGRGGQGKRWTISIHCNRATRVRRDALHESLKSTNVVPPSSWSLEKNPQMGFPPWTPDSPFFLSPYHIPVIPVSSSLTVAICSYLEWPSKWPQSVQKSKGQRKFFLGAAVKTNS